VKNKRVWLLLLFVMLIPIVPWLLVGAPMENWLEGAFSRMSASTSQTWMAAVFGVAVLAADSFFPVPSTLVMSALGLAFGIGVGGALASFGLCLSGTIAYAGCRTLGGPLARKIVGEKDLARVGDTMARYGVLTIAVTRSVPVVQEATACLAGLSKMRFRDFFGALVAGCIPTGFAYAAIGASALHSQTLAVVLSVAVPIVTWPVIYGVLQLRRRKAPAGDATR
jgi:uncharacterized membrane protein YdjX (TVP38/TMEM64 family)